MNSFTKVPLVVILAMIFAGLSLSALTGAKQMEKVEKSEITMNLSPSRDIRIIHGRTYKLWDGGLYQDLETGKIYDRYTI
jgi:hypothetical protein